MSSANYGVESIIPITNGFRIDKENRCIHVVDQTLLPAQYKEFKVNKLAEAIETILQLKVRGAPAIALFSVYVLVLELQNQMQLHDLKELQRPEFWKSQFEQISHKLLATRPTAVNLQNAMDSLHRALIDCLDKSPVIDPNLCLAQLQNECDKLYTEDKKLCLDMAMHASQLIPAGARILTHCNTGALATAGIGTAIGAFYTVQARSIQNREKPVKIYATETRPLLQGARLTAFELQKAGIDVCLITDAMPANLMQRGGIDLVMVGADRIALNGDTANKIGTLSLAVLAHHYKIPFYVVAPSTSIDRNSKSAESFVIEQRNPEEIRKVLGTNITPDDMPVDNPAFDVTPANLITAIITQNKIHRSPYLLF